MALANALGAAAGGDPRSPLHRVAGMLLGLVAIPVSCVLLPLGLSRRWGLPRSWLPPRGHRALSVALVVVYVFLINHTAGAGLLAARVDPVRFLVHFVSAMFFHVAYYPLFAVLIFSTARAWRGTAFAALLTSGLFSLYHLAQFHFFPAGTRPGFLLLLFAIFLADLALYLFTRSLLLVAFAHCVTGAVGMAAEGTYYGLDVVFFLAIALVAGVVVHGLRDQRRVVRAGLDRGGFWPLDVADVAGGREERGGTP